jgi:hypothetical protein
MRPLILALCLAVPLLAACSRQVHVGDRESGPQCGASVDQLAERGSVSGLLLMAQSVPAASLVPCVRPLPYGWSFGRLEATDRGAHFWLTSDHHGDTAVRVDLGRDCSPAGATQMASDEPLTARYDKIDQADGGYRGDRFYRYAGGCITHHFDLHRTVSSDDAIVITQVLGMITRDALQRYVHDYSDGRFELDGTQP